MIAYLFAFITDFMKTIAGLIHTLLKHPPFITQILLYYNRAELYSTGVTIHALEPSGYRTNLIHGNVIRDIVTKRFEQLDEERKSYYGEKFVNDCKYRICCIKS